MSKINRRDFIKAGIGTILIVPKINAALSLDSKTATLPLVLDASKLPPQVMKNYLKTGTTKNPNGIEFTADSRSLLLNDKPFLPVMGEFHYSRYPEDEWRDEILKMKMGGIDIMATYVFWIHHEEIEGQFDWTGQRNLRKFVELCKELEMPLALRIGPWCHGEVRNGGFPDWLMNKGWKLRTEDANYLGKVNKLYGEISIQVKGLFWKDGGNIVSVQLENEFKGRAEYMLSLKRIAREAGIDAPIYTRTGWTNTTPSLPVGEILPLYGVYAEGFWDREIKPMPGKYKEGFLFQLARTDASIATDQLGTGKRKDGDDADVYPFFCCEIGGGMMPSYHRRILIYPKDIESTSLIKIGSGNNLQGYYMYHGGTNPEGKLSTLQESQATNYWNDMPVKSYDFQAPLGEFGQINPHYHSLRRMHLFLRDFGSSLATMPAYLPEKHSANADDHETLRWTARTNGESGYVFVNNYQRLQKMSAKTDVQFQIKLLNETLNFPKKPFTVPEDAVFFLPFNLKIGDAKLIYATAQPICKLEENNESYLFFKEIEGISTEFQFDEKTKFIDKRGNIYRYKTASEKIINLVLLTENESKKLWKAKFQGQERIFLANSGLIVENDKIKRFATDTNDLSFSVFPAVKLQKFKGKQDGIFQQFELIQKPFNSKISIGKIHGDTKIREIKNGSKGVAEAPNDEDFKYSADWQITFPKEYQNKNLILRINYLGDVARLYSGDTLLTDNFYNGNAFEIGLNRFASDIYKKDLVLKVLPLRKDAPIYLADEAKPDFKGEDSICRILSVQLVEIYETTLSGK